MPFGICAWKRCAKIPLLLPVAEEHLKTTVETARGLLSKSDPASNFVVGVFEHGQMIGTAGFFRRPNYKERHKGHIWGGYVRPESRGKGVASALMKEIVRRARVNRRSGADHACSIGQPAGAKAVQGAGV